MKYIYKIQIEQSHHGLVVEGGGERKGIEGKFVGIEGMLGSGGRLNFGRPGMVGKLGIGRDGWVVGNVGTVGCGRFGLEGNGGSVGSVGSCRRLRAAKLTSMLEIVKTTTKAKNKHL